MKRRRKNKKKLVVVAAPVPAGPPSKLPEPSAPRSGSKPLAVPLTTLIELVLLVACVVGFLTVAVWIDTLVYPPPPPGWVCWSVTRSTETQQRRGDRCEPAPADGWHIEEWPGVGRIAVPDRTRRYQVRD
jgi:hypothetical protein